MPEDCHVTDNVTTHVDVFGLKTVGEGLCARPKTSTYAVTLMYMGRAHSNGNSNLCHLPLQCYSYYTGI